MDYFTKWASAFAPPDAEASTCMRIMYDGFFAQFGLPNQLHTDKGRNLSLNCSMRCASSQDKNDTIPSTVRWSDRENEQDIATDVEMYGGWESRKLAS